MICHETLQNVHLKKSICKHKNFKNTSVSNAYIFVQGQIVFFECFNHFQVKANSNEITSTKDILKSEACMF